MFNFCLNPCSNGIPSDIRHGLEFEVLAVLILVLMEYPLI